MRFRKLRITWSVLCGIACVLLIAFWVRSYATGDFIVIDAAINKYLIVESQKGIIEVYPSRKPEGGLWLVIPGEEFPEQTFHGFHFDCGPIGARGSLPHWSLILLAAALATAPWIRWTFSLRTLLVATTLIAVALGLVVYFSAKPPATPPLDVGDFDKGDY